MTKWELIEEVAKRTNITKSRAELLVNTIFETMVASLERGEGIEIRGFGSFTVRHHDAHRGRNPKTGKAMHITPKRLPFFKVGLEMKKLVNGEPVEPSGSDADQYDDDEDDDE